MASLSWYRVPVAIRPCYQLGRAKGLGQTIMAQDRRAHSQQSLASHALGRRLVDGLELWKRHVACSRLAVHMSPYRRTISDPTERRSSPKLS